MATTKHKLAPAWRSPKQLTSIKLSPVKKAESVIGDIRQTIDADLAKALQVAAHAYNAALHAAIAAGLDVKAFFERVFHPGDNDNNAADGDAVAKPVTPPTIKLVSIDRKHLS